MKNKIIDNNKIIEDIRYLLSYQEITDGYRMCIEAGKEKYILSNIGNKLFQIRDDNYKTSYDYTFKAEDLDDIEREVKYFFCDKNIKKIECC